MIGSQVLLLSYRVVHIEMDFLMCLQKKLKTRLIDLSAQTSLLLTLIFIRKSERNVVHR